MKIPVKITLREMNSLTEDELNNIENLNAEEYINKLAIKIHQTAREKGWWDEQRNFGEMIALCHSELSELLEAIREGNKESKNIPGVSCAEEEIADTIIRLLDMSQGSMFNIGKALVLKMDFNKNRPYKHGGKKF